MELKEVEIFTISVFRNFNFLKKYGYEFTNVELYGKEPYIVTKNTKLNIEIVFTFLGKFDMQINIKENKFLKTNIKTISLDEIISKSGYKLAPFVPIEDVIKWISEIIQNKFIDFFNGNKSIEEFKVNSTSTG